MPTDFPREARQRFSGAAVALTLDQQLTAGCQRLLKETNTTLNIFLTAVFSLLLSKYTGQEDLIIGSGIASRRSADLQQVIGFFVNMLPLRNYPRKHLGFGQFLKEVADNALEAYNHQDYPFEELVNKLGRPGKPGRNPLFDFVLQTQNMDLPELEIPGLKIESAPVEFSATHFDLVIYCNEESDTIRLDFVYSTSLFKHATIEDMANFFREIIVQVVKDREIKLGDLDIGPTFSAVEPKMHREAVQFDF
jgi:fengycin family lipopeptide synthetase D